MNYAVSVYVSNMDEIVNYINTYKLIHNGSVPSIETVFENVAIKWGYRGTTN